MYLCWGCLHPFTESNLKQLEINQELTSLFEAVRMSIASISELKPTTSKLLKSIESLESNFRVLMLGVEQSIQSLLEEKKLLGKEELLSNPFNVTTELSSNNTITRRTSKMQRRSSSFRRRAASPIPKSPQPPTSETHSVDKSHRRQQPDRRSIANRFGKEVYNSSSRTAVIKHNTPNTNSVLNHVMSSLYLVVESIVSQVSADRGTLWCRCQGGIVSDQGEELISCVVVGPNTKIGPPTRSSTSTGVLGASISTGIAINIGADGPERSVAEALAETVVSNISASEGIESFDSESKCTMLVIPIPNKFKTFSRVCIGVLQLTSKSGCGCFSETDEVMAMGASSNLSHLLSSYKSILTSGMKRVFDPTFLTTKSSEAGVGYYSSNTTWEVPSSISSHAAPMLVHRTGNSGFIVKTDLFKTTREIAIQGRVREVERFQSTLEVAWKQSVASLAEADTKKEMLEKLLEETRTQLTAARQKSPSMSDIIGPTEGNRSRRNTTQRSRQRPSSASASIHSVR